jgi:hypothetical protein
MTADPTRGQVASRLYESHSLIDPNVACWPRFFRGTGLGNRLFPWARAVVYASVNQLPLVAPAWSRFAVRAFFRGGLDLKSYPRQILLTGLFKPTQTDIRGLRRQSWLRSASIHPEPDDFRAELGDCYNGVGKHIILFENDADKFARLNPYSSLVYDKFLEIVQPRWTALARNSPPAVIGVNIRRAKDFRDPKDRNEFFTAGAQRTPLSWFCETLAAVRKALGYRATAVIVSDGTASDLGPLLAIDNVRFHRPGCAASDLLVLSQTKILIASGGSSFSAWSSFLGQMPTVTIPGQSLAWFKLQHPNGSFVGEFDPAHPPDSFLNQSEEIGDRLRTISTPCWH